MRVRLREPVGDHLVDEFVGDERALIDEGLGHFAERRAVLNVGAENVSGGDLRDTVGGHESFGLSSFAYAGSA